MLETIVARQVIFYVVGAIAAIGIIAKLVAGISLKRLVRASSNMSKSNHALMRLVRAKFEHACMVSDKVQNVRAFVDKYVFEYRVIGLRLHSWRQLEKATIWIYGIVSAAGAGLEYYVNGLGDVLYQYAIVGAVGIVVLFLLHITTDERYQLEAAKMYMVDFLENTYAHRYEKSNQKEIQVTVQKAEEDSAAGQTVMPHKAPVQEPDTRPVTPLEAPGTGPRIAPGETDSDSEQPSREPQPVRTPAQRQQYAGAGETQGQQYAGAEAQGQQYARAQGTGQQYARVQNQQNPRGQSQQFARAQGQRQAPQTAGPHAQGAVQQAKARTQEPAMQMKVRVQEAQPEPLAQAVSSPYPQTAGVPQNASSYGDSGKARPGVESASGMPEYQTAGAEAQNGYGQMKDEFAGQEFEKEAKIREILEEFLA